MYATRGDRVETILLRHRIPPASVVVLRDGSPISDTHSIEPDGDYEAYLIEGYDINAIRQSYEPVSPANGAYLKRELSFLRGGQLEMDATTLDLEGVADYVETTVLETCLEFNLIPAGDGVVVGLSGGVDSSTLLLTLQAARAQMPEFRLLAVTFEDCDREGKTFDQARKIAEMAKVEHHMAPSGLAEETFHLNRPLTHILPALMQTRYAHFAMYIDHHTTRRTLEVYAERQKISRIALGLHTTDLVAGLLNGWTTGYHTARLPSRPIGDFTYLYPLAFLLKRELHLYFLKRMGRLATHAHPNAWERNPLDRNFYYYMADLLQSHWPGLERMLFTGHNLGLSRRSAIVYENCENCGSTLIEQPFTPLGSHECDACVVLRSEGYID